MEFCAEFVEFTLFLSGEEAGVASSLVFGGHGGDGLDCCAYDMFNNGMRGRGSSLLSIFDFFARSRRWEKRGEMRAAPSGIYMRKIRTTLTSQDIKLGIGQK